VLLYYITDRTQFSGTESERRAKLLQKVAGAVRSGVDLIQLREKDLATRDLERLACEAMEIVRSSSSNTKLLINSRGDIALAVGADGAHLRSIDISAEDERRIWRKAGSERKPVIAVSCHTEGEVARAAQSGADFVVFGPVFEKRNASGEPRGIDQLRSAGRHQIPVLALGGVTKENAAICVAAGATGIAGIRLFQEGDLQRSVRALRALKSGQSTKN
jgi:thiamine-phosphate pyrophosphorylase